MIATAAPRTRILSSSASFNGKKANRYQKSKTSAVNIVSKISGQKQTHFFNNVCQGIPSRYHLKRHLKENLFTYLYMEFFQVTANKGESGKRLKSENITSQ